jgi:hypothetical protein
VSIESVIARAHSLMQYPTDVILLIRVTGMLKNDNVPVGDAAADVIGNWFFDLGAPPLEVLLPTAAGAPCPAFDGAAVLLFRDAHTAARALALAGKRLCGGKLNLSQLFPKLPDGAASAGAAAGASSAAMTAAAAAAAAPSAPSGWAAAAAAKPKPAAAAPAPARSETSGQSSAAPSQPSASAASDLNRLRVPANYASMAKRGNDDAEEA